MDGIGRARTDEQKAGRAREILGAARALLADRAYGDVSVQEIADRAGVAKGTVFLYYATKETLGLAVLSALLGEWWSDAEGRLRALERPGSPSTVAAAVRRSLQGRDDLLRLLGLMSGVLEANAGDREVVRFRRGLVDGAGLIGREMEEVLPFLRKGEGAEVSLTLHAMMIGIHQVSAGRFGRMPGPDLAAFRVDAPGAIGRTLRIQLEGARAVSEIGPAPAD
jgi:AcrR family transcriptional regulator